MKRKRKTKKSHTLPGSRSQEEKAAKARKKLKTKEAPERCKETKKLLWHQKRLQSKPILTNLIARKKKWAINQTANAIEKSPTMVTMFTRGSINPTVSNGTEKR